MFDLPMGYHQLAVSPESQEILAFQGVDAIKWTYMVMPFGPTNGPATFITFIHDLDSIWKELAKQNSLPINDNTNTCIIVDDIVSWAESPTRALAYMQCQPKCAKPTIFTQLSHEPFFSTLLQICWHQRMFGRELSGKIEALIA